MHTHGFGPHLSVERFALDSGLTVLVLADPSAPVLSYQTWFAVGSRHERLGKTGLAHLLEHLMFHETESVPYGEFDRRLEQAGAEGNAATYLDWTYYVVNLPTSALELVVELEADRMHNLVLRDEQVAAEREVVANERRQSVDDDVDGVAEELLYELAFERHGYGWPTIGRMADIQSLSRADCTAFYRTYYAPNNAVLVVVGDVDPERLRRLLGRHYAGIAAAELPLEDVRPEPPQTAERRLVTEQPTPTPKLALGYRGPSYGEPDHPALVLLTEVLCGGRSSRAHRQLVEEREMATTARAGLTNLRDPGLLEVGLTARSGTSAAALAEAFDAIVGELRREPPAQSELERARARVELAALCGLETVAGKAFHIGFGETVLGRPASLFERLEAWGRVDRSDLLRVARRYLRPENRSVVQIEPAAASEVEPAAANEVEP